MSEQARQWDETVKTLMAQAEIPVPDAEIRKLSEMYAGAEDARRQLRSVALGETEPAIVFPTERSERKDE